MQNLLMQVLLQNWGLNLQPDWIRTFEKPVICTYQAKSPETLTCRFFYNFSQERMTFVFKYPLLFCPILFVLSTIYIKSGIISSLLYKT